ncbi:hypothetical protein BZL30_6692 [Mycobacterium kansasii]|uniref:Uncharacterized protein n=1 Tax=Mycobacterium kansasii TaxID=1768 RepID=A0A1V3WUT1_MYCKA|nr:hypothetical protein BZL30_6692 [Mycobacterium kansasii]
MVLVGIAVTVVGMGMFVYAIRHQGIDLTVLLGGSACSAWAPPV